MSEWLRPSREPETLFRARGVGLSKRVIVYCRTGQRSAVLYLALRRLGYERVYNYDGSWLEWEAPTA